MSPDVPSSHLAVKSGIISLSLMLLFSETTPLTHAGRLSSSAKKWFHFTTSLWESSGKEKMLGGRRWNFIASSFPALLRASRAVQKFHK